MITFQEMIQRVSTFWQERGCVLHQPHDVEVGAGTFNPATFLRSLGPEPYSAAYVEPCRRPTDGRYGTNPNRLQHYFQYQVILKPSPINIQDLYLESLEAMGFDLSKHDVRFVHDDWEAPTLGAWGLGWEVWMDGMEITQFTYFQALGGITLKPVTGEVTYGLERLAMYLQGVDNVYDLQWNDSMTYGDIYHQNEVEWSHYNFEHADTAMWFQHFDHYEAEAKRLMGQSLPLPAYDFVMKASHAFNMLDARGVISVTERTSYIHRIRDLSQMIAASYLESREKKGFPLLKEKAATPPLQLAPMPTFEGVETADFLLEVGSEELPATFVPLGSERLQRAIEKLLSDADIPHGEVKAYGTPRRLAVSVKAMATAKPAVKTERRGPAVASAFDAEGNATRAAEGFFRSLQIAPPTKQQIVDGVIESIEIRELKGKEYLFASITSEARDTAEILAEALPALIIGLDFPKSMRWADYDVTYARPLRWIVCLLGEKVIPFAITDITSGRTSRKHRQRCAGTVDIPSADKYLETLRTAYVMPDIEERYQAISTALDAIEQDEDVRVIERHRVIPQVLHLVEWPDVTAATFDEAFLEVPKEVLISEMVEHQKYFPVAQADGSLVNKFVITADTTPTDHIRHGNTKVLSARLSDGAFLYQQDLKVSLEERNEKLKAITFQKELGSVWDKVQRLVAHVETIERHIPGTDHAKLVRAALLSKSDLASDMVFEFPDLQGVIGHQYADAQGEDKEVAQAIEEQWMPHGETAPLPETLTGTILSLADKIDNLIGCFAVGLKPTSSSDPFALRRQLLGIIKMLISGKHHLPFMAVFRQCFHAFPEAQNSNSADVLKEIEAFTINRIKTVFQSYDLKKDEIEASLASGFTDIYDTFCKVKALHQFRKENASFPLLLEVYKRAKGQINGYDSLTFTDALLTVDAEKSLDHLLNEVEGNVEHAITCKDYDQAYAHIAKIQEPLALLFDKVKILDDDPKVRDNRIALLQRVFALFDRLLDFGKIVV